MVLHGHNLPQHLLGDTAYTGVRCPGGLVGWVSASTGILGTEAAPVGRWMRAEGTVGRER